MSLIGLIEHDLLEKLINSETVQFDTLTSELGLDPKSDFRHCNLVGLDFSWSDIRGFDFTGSDLSHTKWANAIYDETTILVDVDLSGAWGRNALKDVSFVRVDTKYQRQTTIAENIVLTGNGIHTGSGVSILLSPANPDTGIIFVIPDGADGIVELSASYNAISNVTLCTVLSDDNGATVASVEHLLAAIRGLGVDNIRIETDSGEVPIMDGSSEPFVNAIDEVGISEQNALRRYIKVLKRIRVEDGQAWAELTPHDDFFVDVGIEFDSPLIGNQRIHLEITPDSFRNELSRARTFGFMKDVESLWAAGLALGASLDNTVAIGDDRVINPEGLRFADEFVRHKALDAVGDLALAGAPILGAYRSQRGGHRLNSLAVKALLADKSAWTFVEAPRRRGALHAESGFGAVGASKTSIANSIEVTRNN